MPAHTGDCAEGDRSAGENGYLFARNHPARRTVFTELAAQLPDLFESLQGRDLGHLRIVAELWELELSAPDARIGLQRLAPLLLDPLLVKEVVDFLPAEARLAVSDLLRNEGRLPWQLFTRRYGTVREMGPGRRDRERPFASPASPAEMLWYRALVGRAFFDTPSGPAEFAYIPEDLLSLIPGQPAEASSALGRPASPSERSLPIPASDRILEHACTLLAALRLGLPVESIESNWAVSPGALPTCSPVPLRALLSAAGLLDAAGLPLPEPTRAFLEVSRAEALAILVRAWMYSASFNELHLLPGLCLEGEWQNDPLHARRAILDFLTSVPGRQPSTERPYWSLPAFVAAVRQAQPDFQRPAGDYDSWFVRREGNDDFLRGFEHWDDVDGALIRYLVSGPLHWLGILDLAAPAENFPPSAFRFSNWAASLLSGTAPDGLRDEGEQLKVRSDARLHVPRLAPRSVRYQVARFCAWEGEKDDGYQYRIIPASLERARQQGLRVNHLLALLRRHAFTVPPSLARALERWEEFGSQVRLEQVIILRLGTPDLLQALRNSRAARFLGDPLGPTTVIVNQGAWKRVLEVLAEMGYLSEGEVDD